MKSPRNAGPFLFLLTAVIVVVAATAPRAGGSSPMTAGFTVPAPSNGASDSDSAAPVALNRKACRFGQRYSSYYRRCVLWTPFELG